MAKYFHKLFKLKNDILSLIFVIFTAFVIVFALFLLIYDAVQIVLVLNTNKYVTNFFININIIGIVLGLIDLVYFIVLIIRNFMRVKSR